MIAALVLRSRNPALTSCTVVSLGVAAFVRELSKLGFFLIARAYPVMRDDALLAVQCRLNNT